MVNIQDPLEPVFAGCVSEDGYTHETQCTIYNGPDVDYAGHELCFSSNVDTLTIVDVTDKNDPVQVSRTGYDGSGYTHQGWLTEDQRYFLLNDELDECQMGHNSWTYIWDLADLDAPVLMGHYVGATTAIDHNLYVKGDYVFESNYRAGLRILDATGVSAASLAEVAFFDIYPEDNANSFNANWNNYPFFPSGNVILSGIEQGLFVVTPILDPHPTSILVTDASVTEGNSGEVTASFTVSLTRAVPDIVTVSYLTGLGNATPGVDYESASGVLTFDPDETSQVVEVTVFGDTASEPDETFRLNLSGASNARIADFSGTGRILDDDAEPAMSVSDAVVSEGDGPGTTASFTVSLSGPSGQVVSATFTTSHGTAGAGDYTATNVVVELLPGATSTEVHVGITGDELDESDESFLVELSSPTFVTLADAEATGTIQDDDTLLLSTIDPASGLASGGVAVDGFGRELRSRSGRHHRWARRDGRGRHGPERDHGDHAGAPAGDGQRRRRVDPGPRLGDARRRLLRGLSRRGRLASFPRLRGRRRDRGRHGRLRRRELLSGERRHARADGGLSSEGRERRGPHPAGLHRNRVYRRALHRRNLRPLDRGARRARHHRGLRRRQLLSERPRHARADGGVPAQDEGGLGVRSADRHRRLR